MGLDYMDMKIKLFELDKGRINKVTENIIRGVFEDMQKGIFPKFGSPETRCSKCMFYKVICLPQSRLLWMLCRMENDRGVMKWQDCHTRN